MATIYIIYDFSPARPDLFHDLAYCRDAFAKKNIFLADFNPWACEIIASHNTLWDTWYRGQPFPQPILEQYQSISRTISSGKNVLLLSHAIGRDQHEFFWENLAKFVELARVPVKTLFILGAPVFLLENYFRDNPAARAAQASALVKAIEAIPALITATRQKTGSCQIMANKAASPCAMRDSGLFQQIFSFLGIKAPKAASMTLHALAFNSSFCRRLWRALEARENAWPKLDAKNIAEALKRIDEGEDFLSPREARQKLAGGGIQASFEKICKLKSGALACHAAIFEKPEIDGREPLPEAACQKFVGALSQGNRRALLARYQNDRELLSGDQKAIMATLAREAESGGDFAQVAVERPRPLLAVLTMAYNHEEYIKKCMDSVLAQQTDFPVLHIVLDHHSTDATPEIIAEYAAKFPSIRPVLLSQRRWCENVSGLFERCHTVYAALCDGDDYFLDPRKLRLQVEYLEKRPDYALCFHPVAAVYEDGSQTSIFPPMSYLPKLAEGGFSLDDLANGNFIQTNSVVYRWRFPDGLPGWFRADLIPGDWYWHMLHAENGKIGYIPRVMSVYRRHAKAIYSASARSSVELRRSFGLAELAARKACGEHFGSRYKEKFRRAAKGVIDDFEAIAKADGDASLLEAARKAYPEFC